MMSKQEQMEGEDKGVIASKGTDRQHMHWSSAKITLPLLITGLILLALALNISRAVRAGYNHDEDQFIASARLLLDEGLLPYRDYPYFHMPYLVFVYALLFSVTDHFNLLAARLFSAVCATTTVMLVFWIVLQFFRDHPHRVRYLAAFGIAFLFLPNPLLAATAGFSWNHNLAILCMLASLWLFMLGPSKKYPGLFFFASGLLLGIAIGVRISSLTILPAYLLALTWLPGRPSWKPILRLGLLFLAGLVLALLPLLWLFLSAPQQFIFGNFGYAQLNSAYRLDVPVAYDGSVPIYGARSLAEKISFLWNDVITQPNNILLLMGLLFLGWSVLIFHLKRHETQAYRNFLVLAAVPFVALGSFLPTPVWYQYFYAPIPFALLTIALGLSYITLESIQARKWFLLFLVQLAFISCIIAFQDFRRMSFLRYVDLWKPLAIHQVGLDIRGQVGAGGKVFTIAPLYPLEGGLRVYPPMVTGVFAFRTGSLLSAEQRQQLNVISNENFEDYLDADLPDGILVGFNQILEEPIIQFAMRRGYQPHPFERGLTLWVRSGINPP